MDDSKLMTPPSMKRMGRNCCRMALAAALTVGLPTLRGTDQSPALALARQLNQAFIEVAEKVSPAVVVIEVAHRPGYHSEENDSPFLDIVPPDLRRRYQEHAEKERSEKPTRLRPVYDGRGSGIVIREDGWIITNNHVVEGAEKLRVRFKDGQSYDAGGKWWTDPQSDIAVIKVEARGLATAPLADSSKTRVGELAVAIGAPFDLDYSVTFGHVSAKGRSHIVPAWGENSFGSSMDQDFIQTDASINPGNSGGPLVNIEGEVIGVNTMIQGMNRGIGFAIPSNLARQIAEHLITDGKFTRAWLGLQISALRENLEFRELVSGLTEGVVVEQILPNGPASKSKLKPADIIVAVEGKPVSTGQQLREEVRAHKIGSPILLEVVRPEISDKISHLQVSVQTEEWPEESAAVAARQEPRATAPSTEWGLTVQPLSKDLAKRYHVEIIPGVVVTEVERDSLAALNRIRPGDIITEVNSRPVTTVKQYKDAIGGARAKPVLLQLVSEGIPGFKILKDSGD